MIAVVPAVAAITLIGFSVIAVVVQAHSLTPADESHDYEGEVEETADTHWIG